MVIIKHGTAYEESDSYSCICPKCDCEFEYVTRDIHSYLNEECYIICPECFSDIKLPNVNAADIVDLPPHMENRFCWSWEFQEVEDGNDD